MDNLRLACDWCNHHRSNRDVEDFLSSFAFKRRKHQEMRTKTIEPYGGGYDHVGPVVRTRSPYETYRCEACQSTSKRRRLDEVPCVEVIVLQRRKKPERSSQRDRCWPRRVRHAKRRPSKHKHRVFPTRRTGQAWKEKQAARPRLPIPKSVTPQR